MYFFFLKNSAFQFESFAERKKKRTFVPCLK